MVSPCPVCAVYPNSHSFHFIYEKNDIAYFYSCPSQALLSDDADGILSHFDKELTKKQGKKWVWIFNAQDFGMKHMMQMRLAIDLARLISNKFGEMLTKIVIINKTWHIDVILNTVWFFLSDHVRGIITENNDDVKDIISDALSLDVL
jgi:hypothetical protein